MVKVVSLDSPYRIREKGKTTKSQKDLANQMYRIVHLSKDPDNDPRIQRAQDIADRYQENMMRTNRRRMDVARYITAMQNNDEKGVEAARKQIVERQYSRRSYMGLSNG